MPPLPKLKPRHRFRSSQASPEFMSDTRVGREVGHTIRTQQGVDSPLGRLASRLNDGDPTAWKRATAGQLEDILAMPGLSPRMRRALEKALVDRHREFHVNATIFTGRADRSIGEQPKGPQGRPGPFYGDTVMESRPRFRGLPI